MTDAKTIFNTSGKIPTDSKFWAQDDNTWMTELGITQYFSKVLGEQVYSPLKKPQIAFYSDAVGRPLVAGAGWRERVLKKTIAKHFKPKADASDDLAFYDNGGYEWEFGVNVAGWRPVTIPSDFETLMESIKAGEVGEVNSMLVENVINDYQRDQESDIQLKAISTTKNHVEVNPNDYVGMVKKINEVIREMKGTTVHYNDVTTYKSTGETINDNIYTNSEVVRVYIYAGTLDKIRESLAGYPSPDKIFIDAEVRPLVDPLPAAITTDEWEAGQSEQGWDENIQPVAIDTAAPIAFVCSAKRFEYRPVTGSYKINLSKNGAGDFINEHLIWKGAFAVRPWENAVRIMGDEQLTGMTGIPVDIVGAGTMQAQIVNTTSDPVNTKEVSP